MAATVSQIRDGLVANLKAAYPGTVQVNKYVLSTPTPPALQIRSGPVNYDLAMHRGLDDLTMIVQALTQRSEAGQAQIDLWIASGPGGVKAAIESDRTLGGTVNDARVESVSELAVVNINQVDLLVVEFSVKTYPEGDN